MSVQLMCKEHTQLQGGYVVNAALAVVMMLGGSYSEGDGSILGEGGV